MSCEECQEGRFGCLNQPTPCAGCSKLLCANCAGKYPLVPFDSEIENNFDEMLRNKKPDQLIKTYCKSCFQQTSTVDFSESTHVMEPTAHNGMTLVMVHGGGATRAMYHRHAVTLAERDGYRCILLDLPGHGSLVDSMKLSLDACVLTVQNVMQKYNLQRGDDCIYVGASLGAYVGFYILDKLPPGSFVGAVLMDCGQNVGPGASFHAKIGLSCMKMVTGHMSNKTIMSSMLPLTKKSRLDYHVVETIFGAGMCFDQGVHMCECLESVAPAELIPRLDLPILFMNGSKDYRDSENKWLELCKHQELSSLYVYEGGDHFFTHKREYANDILDRIHSFGQTLKKKKDVDENH